MENVAKKRSRGHPIYATEIVRLQKSTMQFVPLYELALNSRLRQIALTFMNTYFFSNKKVTF